MRMRFGVAISWVTVCVVGLFLLVGCVEVDQVANPNDESAGPYAPGKIGKMKDCLEAAGWEVIADGGSLSGPPLPEEQAPLYKADEARCAEETQFFDPWTAEDYHRLYPLEIANHQCLLDHGYDSADPPSEQQFVDDWLAESPDNEPYQAIGVLFYGGNNDEFRVATQVCPPPLWSL